MSENRGKAKAKPTTAKSAGKNKAAVMNSRNPKKPMAISGDTMSNYAMYKKGGKVSKIKKYQTAGPVNTSGPRAVAGDMNLTEVKNQYNSDKIKIGNKEKVNAILSGNEADARNAKEIQQAASKKIGGKVSRYEKGGTTKKYKSGGSFPDLNKDGKITKADILKGRGVFSRGGVKKYAMGGHGDGPSDDPVKSAGTGDKVKMIKDLYDRYLKPKKSININNMDNRKPEKKLLAKRGGMTKSRKK